MSDQRQKDRKSSGIYRIRNAVNCKCYVGSAVNVSQRLYHHKWHLECGKHRNKKLLNAWRKYGAGSFVFEVLEIVRERGSLIEREQYWIDTLLSYSTGYNLNPRAGSNLGRTFGAGTRAKISAAAKRVMGDPEIKARHSAAVRAAMRNPEVKRRTSEAARKRWGDPEYRAKLIALRTEPSFRKRLSEIQQRHKEDPEIRASRARGYAKGKFTRKTPEYKQWVSGRRKADRAREWGATTLGEQKEKRAWMGKISSKSYAVSTPEGEVFVIHNLKRFCKNIGVPYVSALRVVSGRYKTAHGYAFKRAEGGQKSLSQ